MLITTVFNATYNKSLGEIVQFQLSSFAFFQRGRCPDVSFSFRILSQSHLQSKGILCEINFFRFDGDIFHFEYVTNLVIRRDAKVELRKQLKDNHITRNNRILHTKQLPVFIDANVKRGRTTEILNFNIRFTWTTSS